MSNNIYDILGKLNRLNSAETSAETVKEPVYESVDAKGDIMEAVRSLEEKYEGFKKEESKEEYCDACDSTECKCCDESIEEGREFKNKEEFDKFAKTGDSYKSEKGRVTKTDTGIKHERSYAGDDSDKDLDESAKPDYLDLDKDGDKEEPMKKAAKDSKELDEVAPPGAKAERMVKHIKKGYAKDGKLTKKEKGIAYATAWKAHNKGQVEEATQFNDKIKNSAPNMKEAKPAMVKEGRVMEETDYFYEKVAKALCEKNPHLDTASSDFVSEVRKEMVAQGIEPNRARNIIMMDEDFISDVASSYGHYCQEVAEDINQSSIASPTNDMPITSELDEIARLAGLRTETVGGNPAQSFVKDISKDEDELNEAASRKDFRAVANLLKNIPDEAKRRELANHHADIFKQQNPRFKRDVFLAAAGVTEGSCAMSEAEVDEGNEFTKARLDAIAAGKDTFQVGGKEYSVAGDTSDEKAQVAEGVQVTVSANADDADGIHILQLLSGLKAVADVQPQQQQAPAPQPLEQPLEQPAMEERDIEYSNTPNEKIAPLSAATPSGNDLHKSKLQDPHTANKAANPLAEKDLEESLWNSYEEMLEDVKV